MQPLEILRLKHKAGAGSRAMEYIKLTCAGKNVGFISDEGVFLLMENEKEPEGIYVKMRDVPQKSAYQQALFLQKHWEAIYDRYYLAVRGNIS